MVKIFGSHNMAVLYPNQYYNEVCYKGDCTVFLMKVENSVDPELYLHCPRRPKKDAAKCCFLSVSALLFNFKNHQWKNISIQKELI